MTYLIIVTFGPVQSYISQARRTQDLLQGSRILSHLADEGVRYAMQNANVIYPILQDSPNDEIAGTPNRIVATIDVDDVESAKSVASGISDAIKQTWQRLSSATLTYFTSEFITDDETLHIVNDIWQRQVENWLSVYWAVDPDGSMGSASARLASRKLLRDFSQIEERGRKCSITGEHEALYDGKSYVEFWANIRTQQRNLSLLGKHERLSAIATIKRFVHERKADQAIYEPLKLDNRFPSTSSIASIPFKYDVLMAIASEKKIDKLETAVKTYVDALLALFERENDLFFNRGRQLKPEHFKYLEDSIPQDFLSQTWVEQFRSIDGDYLFEDTFISSTIEEYSGQYPSQSALSKAKRALSNLITQASAFDIAPPQPYYVILSMDGDKMGKLLECIQNADEHRKFSETLSRYADQDVIRIVQEQHLGRVVYAGGDDVMALLPVRDALEVANELRKAFRDAITNAQVKNRKGKFLTATASTGLAFVHHTHNLQEAVDEANSAQKNIAKKRQKRNALAVRLLRRSGEPRQMRHNWGEGEVEITSRIQALVNQFSDNSLARGLPYDLSNIGYSMASNNVPAPALKAELTRIIRRRLSNGKKHLEADIVENLLSIAGNEEIKSIGNQWKNLVLWVELARFIAQTTREEVKA